jgi:hypothetical protein
LAAAAVSAALVGQVLPEAQLPVRVPLVLVRLPLLAHLVVDSARLLDLLSRQSF